MNTNSNLNKNLKNNLSHQNIQTLVSTLTQYKSSSNKYFNFRRLLLKLQIQLNNFANNTDKNKH